MATVGRVCERVRNRRTSWYLDFSPYLVGAERRLFSDRGHRFESREHAEAILGQIRGLHARLPLSEAVGEYRAAKSKPNLITDRVALWLDEIKASGDYAPYTLQQYSGYAKPGGHFSFWKGRSVYEINWTTLHEWTRWLRERGMGPKSIRNILAAFRSFYSWQRRGREAALPRVDFPKVKMPPGKPKAPMPIDDRARAIEQIPEADRGIFLAMRMGVRPGEARAAMVGDFDFRRGTLIISKAMKGHGAGAQHGETKTGEVGTYDVSAELRQWIEGNVPTAKRFAADAPLFPNPRTGKFYGSQKVRKIWIAACDAADVRYVPPYRATKHSSFTHLAEAGIATEDIQALARHRDPRTIERYLLTDDKRRSRALASLEELELRGRHTGDRGQVATIRRNEADSGA